MADGGERPGRAAAGQLRSHDIIRLTHTYKQASLNVSGRGLIVPAGQIRHSQRPRGFAAQQDEPSHDGIRQFLAPA